MASIILVGIILDTQFHNSSQGPVGLPCDLRDHGGGLLAFGNQSIKVTTEMEC